MSGLRGRRDPGPDKPRPRSLGPSSVMWSSETEKGPPLAQSHSLRDFEQHLSELKKENFSLKLRIYFLENQQNPDQDQDLTKTIIELKVQLQSLKTELEEKDQLLQETLSTAELLSNQCPAQQRGDETTNQLQESLEENRKLQQELQEREEKQRQTLEERDRLISDLSNQNQSLQQKVQDLTSDQRTTEQDNRVCDKTTERCLSELHRAQSQVQTLQSKIRISEDRNKLLQKSLAQMEVELRDVREEAQNQERNLELQQEEMDYKERQLSDLQRVLEEQNRALCSLRDSALRQFSSSPACGVSELQMLMQQKTIVDRELHELKTQLHKSGYSSLSQIRKALSELKNQNQELKLQLSQKQEVMSQRLEQGAETVEESNQWEGWDSQLTFDHAQAQTQSQVQSQESPLHRGGAVDLGYETCERSETEAERDTSSPEFDDLEMCLTLDSNWWSRDQDRDQDQGQDQDQPRPHSTPHRQIQALQRVVQQLKSELNQTRADLNRTRTQLRSQSEAETKSEAETEPDPELADLLSRVETLENQVQAETRTERREDKTGFLIHAQARDLSRLRLVLRESRGLVQVLVQIQTEQLKGVEALLASREPDYDLGERVRAGLREGQDLLVRLSQKISLKDLPEDPDDKTELLAMRLSKELQQKELLIESLRSKLRSNTPSDSTDQSDRISYISDEQLSNQDEDCQDELRGDQSQHSNQTGGRSERSVYYGDQSEQRGHYSSQSEQRGHYSSQSEQRGHYSSQAEQRGHYSSQSERFYSHTDPLLALSSVPPSVASAHSFSTPGHAPSAGLAPLSLRPRPIVALSQPGFSSSSLDSGLRPGFGHGLWDTPLSRPITTQLSPAASSLHSLSGSDLLAEHLSEVRSLRLRLEDSIQTNERLRAHLETRLDPPPPTAPTNIYIQGGDSAETKVLRESNTGLKERLRDSLLEAERLREALLLVQARLKEAELQVQRWAELSRSSQSEASAQRQEVTTLKQEQQRSLEVVQRLQLEVKALQQQLRSQSEQREAAINQSQQGEAAINQSQQREEFRSQSDVSVQREEKRTRRRLQFSVDKGPELNQDWLQLQTVLQNSVDLLKTIVRTQTRTKPGQNQDCEKLSVLLQQARDLSHTFKTRTKAENPEVALLKTEVSSLRQERSEKDLSLRDITEQVQEVQKVQKVHEVQKVQEVKDIPESRCNEALEELILIQLTKTRDVLRKAKNNLQMSRAEVTVS